jgi:hypothetical protein
MRLQTLYGSAASPTDELVTTSLENQANDKWLTNFSNSTFEDDKVLTIEEL